MSGQGWQPIAELRDLSRVSHNQIVLAKFIQHMNDEGEPDGAPEISWAHVAYPTASSWQVGSGGFRCVHGFASFGLHQATHFMPLPEAPVA